MADPHASFALLVSCVDGQPVTRFGTGTMIGATRSKLEPTVVVYDPTAVVGIPHDEYRKHQRAYDRALANGSLVERSADEYRAQERAERVRDDENRKARELAAAKLAATAATPSLALNDPPAGDPPA